MITLSNAGEELVEQVTSNRRERFAAIVARLASDQQQSVIDALETFVKAADEDMTATEAQPASTNVITEEEP